MSMKTFIRLMTDHCPHPVIHLRVKGVILILCCLLVGCNARKTERKDVTSEQYALLIDSTARQRPVDYRVFESQPVMVDTSYGEWHLRIEQFYDGNEWSEKYDSTILRFANYASRISLSKDGNMMLKDFVVTPKSFMGKNYFDKFQLKVTPFLFTTTTCYVYACSCESETDNCLIEIWAITQPNSISRYECNDVIDGDLSATAVALSEFLILYMHECSLAEPSQAVINDILHRYCGPELAARLAHERLKDNPLWGQGTFSPKWLETMYLETMEMNDSKYRVAMHYQKLPDSTLVTRYLDFVPGGDDTYIRRLIGVGQ